MLAGPVEATALGNIAMQMVATGAVSSLAEARRHHRTLVSGRAFRARRGRSLERALSAFPGLRGVDLCLNRSVVRNGVSARISGTNGRGAGERSPLDLLRYRSNLLGEDLRITNFGGGNTSSKFELPDPLTGEPHARDGGEGQRRRPPIDHGRAASRVLYLDKLEALIARYRGEALRRRDGRRSTRSARSARTASPRRSTRRCTRSCRFRTSITCIPTGRSRSRRAPTARRSSTSSTSSYGRHDRLGAVAASRLRAGADAARGGRGRTPAATASSSAATGCSPGATTQRECYLSSITHDRSDGGVHRGARSERARPSRAFGGAGGHRQRSPDRDVGDRRRSSRTCAAPSRRTGASSATSTRRPTRSRSPTRRGPRSCAALGTSCPDHFLRTRISPMFVAWDPAKGAAGRRPRTDRRADREVSRRTTRRTTTRSPSPTRRRCATATRRWSSFPGLGLFGFGKDKREARITTEFFVNAIHVMSGANALEGRRDPAPRRSCRRCGARSRRTQFKTFHNYVALPRLEAFRIEYWALEEAKLQRMPPEKEFSRKIVVVVGGAQRHREGGRAADRAARRPRRGRRSERRRPRPRRRRKPRSCRRPRWC